MHKDFLISRKAPAKVNLHLQVLNRRKDGFHNLLSIMAEVGVYDLLKLESFEVEPGSGPADVEIVNSGGRYSDVLESIPSGENIISVAVKSYLVSLRCRGRVRFSVEKNIPSGAGLGGGSSDAAAALELARIALGREQDHLMFSAAAESGSDVPFFIRGGVAFAAGRGEILEQVNQRIDYPVVLVNNGVHVNTGMAYKALKRGFESPFSDADISAKKNELETVLKDLSLWRKYFVNDFEKPVFELYPELGNLKNDLYDLGAEFALMSGSGSTVYGVFSDKEYSEKAFRELEKRGNRAFIINMGQQKIND